MARRRSGVAPAHPLKLASHSAAFFMRILSMSFSLSSSNFLDGANSVLSWLIHPRMSSTSGCISPALSLFESLSYCQPFGARSPP